MEGQKCSCDRFGRLEGASVSAYVSAFLEEVGRAGGTGKNRYRCCVCGSEWEKRQPEVKAPGTRPSLVRLSVATETGPQPHGG